MSHVLGSPFLSETLIRDRYAAMERLVQEQTHRAAATGVVAAKQTGWFDRVVNRRWHRRSRSEKPATDTAVAGISSPANSIEPSPSRT